MFLSSFIDTKAVTSSVRSSEHEGLDSIIGRNSSRDASHEGISFTSKTFLGILIFPSIFVPFDVIATRFIPQICALDTCNHICNLIQVNFYRDNFGDEVVLAQKMSVCEALSLGAKEPHFVEF